MLMRARTRPERLYWRQSRRQTKEGAPPELWHCYRRTQDGDYKSLCRLSFRSGASEGLAMRRPPIEYRCPSCNATELALRRARELPPSPNWDLEPEETHVHKFMEQFQLIVAQRYGLLVKDMRGPRRSKTIVLARMIAMAVSREVTNASFPEIGRAFGGRDHTTVINAVRKIEYLCKHDAEFREQYERIKEKCEEIVGGAQPPEGDRFVEECREAGLRK